MTHPALAYAEQQLGVHQSFTEAESACAELDEVSTELDKAHDSKRILDEMVADREADLLSEERGKHADMSATALDQHMKQVKRRDPSLANLRSQRNEVVGTISGLEYDADVLKWRMKIAVARMEELGGYLHYLAAVKFAEESGRKNQETRRPTQ